MYFERFKRILVFGVAVLLLLLLVLILSIRRSSSQSRVGKSDRPAPDSQAVAPPAAALPESAFLPAASTSGDAADSGEKKRQRQSRLRHAGQKRTTARTSAPDSVATSPPLIADSVSRRSPWLNEEEGPSTSDSVDPCSRDTLVPWVYPDPSGGLHRGPVQVRLIANKPCRIEWRTHRGDPWQVYRSEAISVSRSAYVFFRATDSCGKQMAEREEFYEIAPQAANDRCPDDMAYIEVDGVRFCIDRYEWPNRRGQRPMSFVSLYEAIDSCFSRGKRLCTSDEWVIACSGPYGWTYPYGEEYEPYACITQDTTVRPSGWLAECRGYFEVFDMSGNLAEWTNTRASRNSQFFYVKGGFWASGSEGNCRNTRYSYFPQNRHNPVGFRCCKDSR